MKTKADKIRELRDKGFTKTQIAWKLKTSWTYVHWVVTGYRQTEKFKARQREIHRKNRNNPIYRKRKLITETKGLMRRVVKLGYLNIPKKYLT